ncbi:MAG: hypothetical protein ABIN37_11230 [Burkholderiaceae bacterium]
MAKLKTNNPVQGEGDYQADQRYVQATRDFVKKGKVADAARSAAPKSAGEKDEMLRAERVGLAHNKGEDPAPGHAPRRKP